MSQADLTHQRLVRAALELFTTQGYQGTAAPVMAKKAGVAEGSIYRHFDGKQRLLNELYRGAARWAGKLVKEADGLRVGPREKLAELARALVQGAAREPAVARLFLLQRHDALLDDESRKAARDFRLGLESLIAQGKADGTVKPGAAEVWAAPRQARPARRRVAGRPSSNCVGRRSPGAPARRRSARSRARRSSRTPAPLPARRARPPALRCSDRGCPALSRRRAAPRDRGTRPRTPGCRPD